MSIPEKLQSIEKWLPASVKLVAVSKTKPNSDILEAYQSGQRIFGENKVQDLTEKHEALPKDIEWHFIGHLQTNKVKYIAPFVTLIHGCDTLKVLKEINKQAIKCERVIDCLLQLHIAKEENKFGFTPEALMALIADNTLASLPNIRVVGIMGMATYTSNTTQIRQEFQQLKNIYEQISPHFEEHFEILSMGMSNDYKIAIEEGSNMLRLGSVIFGERNY